MKQYNESRVGDILKIGEFVAKYTQRHLYKDNCLYSIAQGKMFVHSPRPTRVAGNYKIYVDAFPRAAAPYSIYRIADVITGKVYEFENYHYLGSPLKSIVELLKTM